MTETANSHFVYVWFIIFFMEMIDILGVTYQHRRVCPSCSLLSKSPGPFQGAAVSVTFILYQSDFHLCLHLHFFFTRNPLFPRVYALCTSLIILVEFCGVMLMSLDHSLFYITVSLPVVFEWWTHTVSSFILSHPYHSTHFFSVIYQKKYLYHYNYLL